MAFLSSLFGNNDSDSTQGNSNDFWNDLDVGLGIQYQNESYHQEIDEDGSSETSYDSTSFGTELNASDVLQSMSDSFSSFDG